MLYELVKFGDDRTPEQCEADRLSEKAKFDKMIAELKLRSSLDNGYDPYIDYMGDKDEALEQG